MKKNALFLFRLINALSGIKQAFKSESSFRVQIAIALCVMIIASVLHLAGFWLALVVVLIAQVLAFELINTAIEAICDLVHPSYSEKIKRIKDMAAGAVLLSALSALCIVLIKWIDN